MDIFTLKTVSITPELGMAIKNFRIENKKTAKSITEKFGKASSYISKLEKGDIKKIESTFLIQLCNYITNSENGLSDFLNKLSQNFKDFTNETKFIVMNIDDLLLDHTVPVKLIMEINEYLSSHNLSVTQLVDMINSNVGIANRGDYKNLPKNIWYSKDYDIDNGVIKLDIPETYVENLLNQKIVTIHRVIAEAILNALYMLGEEEQDKPKARQLACDKLESYHILPERRILKITDDNIDKIFGGLEPDTADALKKVTTDLKLIATLTKNYGSKGIKQISNNLSEDLGFFFAYMSIDIVKLEKKDKEKKKQFLNELRSLVEKYSQEDSGIDIYD